MPGLLARTLSPALIFCAFLSLSCAKPNAPADPSPEVRAVLQAQMDAWNQGDLEGYMKGYWNSPELVFFSNGTQTKGYQPTLDRYRARYQAEGKEMGKLTFPGLDILPFGPDAALARGRWHLTMSNGKEMEGMTSVFLRRFPEGFRIVHDHSSMECATP